MPTDDERRDVARRLREMAEWGGEDCTEGEYYSRLADLIEPGEPKVKCVAEVKIEGDKLDEAVHRAMAEYAGVDRDALLALADEMQFEQEFGSTDYESVSKLCGQMDDCARRIREACGEDGRGGSK